MFIPLGMSPCPRQLDSIHKYANSIHCPFKLLGSLVGEPGLGGPGALPCANSLDGEHVTDFS